MTLARKASVDSSRKRSSRRPAACSSQRSVAIAKVASMTARIAVCQSASRPRMLSSISASLLVALREDVARAAARVDERRAAAVHLAAEARHADVDRIGAGIVIVVPDVRADVGASDDASRVAREILEQR